MQAHRLAGSWGCNLWKLLFLKAQTSFYRFKKEIWRRGRLSPRCGNPFCWEVFMHKSHQSSEDDVQEICTCLCGRTLHKNRAEKASSSQARGHRMPRNSPSAGRERMGWDRLQGHPEAKSCFRKSHPGTAGTIQCCSPWEHWDNNISF